MLNILLIFLTLFGVCLSACPDGFIQHAESCYMELHLQASWAESKYYCKHIGGDLLRIESAEEELYITNYLSRLSKTAFTPGEFWTDGTSLFTNATIWQWAGNNAPLSFTAWLTGNPTGHTQQRCLALGFKSKFKWYSAVCEAKYNCICEAQP